VYAVVALGYTMVYGIIQLINFAHGELVMVGAMIAFSVLSALAGSGVPPVAIVLIATACAVPLCMLLGYGMERVAYRPLRGAPRLAPLITAIGVSIILQYGALMIWSRNPLAFPQVVASVSYPIGGATITNIQLAIIAISTALMASLAWLVYRTKLGTAMRAVSQNPQVAGLMGIDADRIISLTFVIGAGLAAVAGVMVASYYGIAHYTMGANLGLKAFCAAVLGGIGNIPGAMLGGVLLGIVEALGAGYIGDFTNLCALSGVFDALAERCKDDPDLVLFGSNYQDVFAFLVLIAVLVLRPSGLLGERVGDRA
jgi:branched-chain amino acid transport system permease protein